jgi:hypothetical protein
MKIEPLNYKTLLSEDEYSNWGSNKVIAENLTTKINELTTWVNWLLENGQNMRFDLKDNIPNCD